MSFSIGYSLTDRQLEAAMQYYDYEGMKDLKKQIRSDIDDFVEEEVVND